MFASRMTSITLLVQFLLSLFLLSFSTPAEALVIPQHRNLASRRKHGLVSSVVEQAASATATSASATRSSSADSSSSTTSYTGGEATYFYQDDTAGACGTVHSDSDLIVALDEAIYSSDLCGKTVVITNTATLSTVTATVADECPGCSNSASLDLSVAAFEALGELSEGVLQITWVLY